VSVDKRRLTGHSMWYVLTVLRALSITDDGYGVSNYGAYNLLDVLQVARALDEHLSSGPLVSLHLHQRSYSVICKLAMSYPKFLGQLRALVKFSSPDKSIQLWSRSLGCFG
jgi:hypothetical protein